MKILFKHLVSLTILSFFVVSLSGQINYSDINFAQALEKAKTNNQLIFVQMQSNCIECNEVADRGLANEQVAQIYNTFVCLKVFSGTSDYAEICNDFRVSPIYPTSLILDNQANFLSIMYDKSTSRYEEYIQLAAVAMSNLNHPPLAEYGKRYSDGENSSKFLRDYITILREFRFETDELLDEYIGKLYVDSLFTPDALSFIIQSAPLVDSRPYKLSRFNYELFDTVFMSLPLKERIALNNLVVGKSRKKAFKDKDERYMQKVASFDRGRYEDRQKGRRVYSNDMLDFFKEIKDTTRYIQDAKNYYQWHLKKLDIDSISTAENNDFIKTKEGRIIKRSSRLVVGNQVNKLAWSIYELTDDREILGMISKWAERILVYENPAFHDTYAHILYKLGAKQKAIEWQEKAIELSKVVHRPTDKLEEELEKMKTD